MNALGWWIAVWCALAVLALVFLAGWEPVATALGLLAVCGSVVVGYFHWRDRQGLVRRR